MPIPNARADPAPPPLPPPRFIDGLANGHDVGWQFANKGLKGGFSQKSQLAPIKQGSSLHGGYMQRLNTSSKSGDLAEDDDDDESDRKSSTISNIRSSSQPDIQMGFLGAAEDDGQNATSPSSIANQRYVYLLFASAYTILDRLHLHVTLLLRHGTKDWTIENLTCSIATMICR
jgi:hypothetical protein